MKLRLLGTLLAAAALGGCATYDYSAGSAPGGYYYGRPSASYVGPYNDGYGYGGISYGYGGYGSGYYGGYGYSRPYYGYGGYNPYYPHRPYHPRPPRPDTGNPKPPERGDRPPPWRNPDGRYQESGKVMIPPRQRPVPTAPTQPALSNPGRPQMAPPSRPMVRPAPSPQAERPRQMEARSAPPARVRSSNERARTVEP